MVIGQGDVWWADLPDLEGSEAGFRRPVLVVQGDAINRSRFATILCVPLASNLKWSEAPGNVLLPARLTRLPKDSVAIVAHLVAVDRTFLTGQIGKIPKPKLKLVFAGIDVVLGKS